MTSFRDGGEQGTAMVIAMVALSLLTAVAAVMLITSSSETLIAGAFRDQRAGVYAADAIVARAADEIGAIADWNVLLAGVQSATIVDGPPSGTRTLADGATIDLMQVVNMANCQKPVPCTVTDLNTATARRPWGANNPRWQLFAYAPLRALLPAGTAAPPWYVVLLVADDPLRAPDTIVLRAEAFGVRNGHTTIELSAARPGGSHTDYNGGEGPAPMSIESWREVR